MLKEEIRESILRDRNSLARQQVYEKSRKIGEFLFSLPDYQNASAIMFYISKGSEVDTHHMIEHALKEGKIVVVPVTDKKNKTLLPSRINSLEGLREGPFGIMEPKDIDLVNSVSINLVIVPMVAFDKKLDRIGTGHGYYDNFLSHIPAKKIGLAYQLQIVNKIPSAEYDVKMDKIVTEQKIIQS